MHHVPEYITNMIRREIPQNCDVVPRSTPVVSFGNFQKSRVATLGINPSNVEFEIKGRFLSDEQRRLATLESLGCVSTIDLTDDQVATVLQDCENYFDKNPYRQWFEPLDRVLTAGLGVSYFDGSACHLDLVQWATQTKWGDLSQNVRDILLTDGKKHLINQLTAENIKYVIVCGRAVWDELSATQFVEYDEVKTIHFGAKNTPCKLRIGQGHNTTFLGWTSNIQSQHGANSNEFLSELSEWLQEQTDSLR